MVETILYYLHRRVKEGLLSSQTDPCPEGGGLGVGQSHRDDNTLPPTLLFPQIGFKSLWGPDFISRTWGCLTPLLTFGPRGPAHPRAHSPLFLLKVLLPSRKIRSKIGTSINQSCPSNSSDGCQWQHFQSWLVSFTLFDRQKEQTRLSLSFDITSNHFHIRIVRFSLQVCFHNMPWTGFLCGFFSFFFFFQMSLLKNFSGIFQCCPRQAIMLPRVRYKRKEVPVLFTATVKNYRTAKGKWSEQFFRGTRQRRSGPVKRHKGPRNSQVWAYFNFFF